MGSGSQKAHEAIAIAPSIDAADADVQVLDAATDQEAIDAKVNELLADLTDDDYAKLTSLDGLTPAEFKALTKAYLTDFDTGELQQLAAEHGFEHPTLVGLDDDVNNHPLIHWLDPAYPADSVTKLKIQAKANERYDALQAGETIHGLTLSDVQAAEAALGITPPPPEWEPWEATPAEVAAAVADVTTRAVTVGQLSHYSANAAEETAALIAAENKLQTAHCAEMGDELDHVKSSVAQLVQNHTVKVTGPKTSAALAEAGLLTPDEAAWLSPSEALAAARYSSGASQVGELKELASSRVAVVDELKTHKAAGVGKSESFTGIDTSTAAGRQELLQLANATQAAFALNNQMHTWGASADQATLGDAQIYSKHLGPHAAKDLTKDFRAWAKTQKLGDLRTVAESAGLGDSATAGTRADIQNYIAGQWDTAIDQAAIEAKLKAKTNPVTTVSTPPSASSPAAAAGVGQPSTPVAVTTPVAATTGPGRFSGKLGTLTAKLKAHQQITADLPARTDTASVDGHQWGSGESWSKGSHESSLHKGPNGQDWMFKPDKSAKGARAHAESAASNVFHRVGVPGVDVHVATIGNRTGAIQPLVKGASNLSGDSSSWSQTDVDSMVRLHVAAWAVGDHDGHTSNVMRSPSGAIFAVDQGQAFKFFGRDKLDHGWHPSGNYGTPVYHQAYAAAADGTLAAGVEVRAKAALPVIKAFEALPDKQYRQMLTPTATEGVKHGVHWVEPMRKAAQKRLGKTKVSDGDVAEEFLRTAVDRKNNLRSAFASFFGGLGVSDAQHLTWVN